VATHSAAITDCSPAERAREWRRGLPALSDGSVALRELRSHDAPSLLAHLNHPRVLEFIAPCPSTIDGFRRFIRWTHAERRRGQHACYGIIPPGETTAVGIVQIWRLERDFSTAEWGFALGESYWGTGVFKRSARLFLDTAFGAMGVRRLEARAVDRNYRGHGVLRSLGATAEGILAEGFRTEDSVRDHVMWSILAREWLAAPNDSARASQRG
jgi:RimJ/RimL family protein N-acetyltransferase